YEAIVETYIPLLRVLRQLAAEKVPARLAFTLTPSLCEMLRDPLLQARAERYLARGVELARSEIERTTGDAALNELARFYLRRFTEAQLFYTRDLNRDIVGAFAQLQADGMIEIITCAATHGFLPLMDGYPEAMRAQILIGRDSYVECFGREPSGIWLPECAYVAPVGRILQEANIRWFVVDAHGIMFGQPKPRFAIYSPYYTPAGPAVFGRDRDSSRQVWSQREGYPGDPAYRDFYRDIGQDLPLDYLSRFMPTEHRSFTGIKYHRITGAGADKQLYNLSWAAAAADAHAGHFLDSRVKQLEHLRGVLPVEPIVLSPFDAELFGHWWFEGPEFLNFFLRKAAFDQKAFRLSTPSDYLKRNPTQQLLAPAPSSWGNKGYWEVWLDQCNAWIYPHLHAAARRMTECARLFASNPTPDVERALRQMARELLLAQSSDWAFLMKTGTAREYATQRTKDHLLRFTRLYENLVAGVQDDAFVEFCESRDSIFPNVQWRYYA
ncbi:MAG: glycoside hydrolase family 57 protein, partial [Chthoniobacterales bacterium]